MAGPPISSEAFAAAVERVYRQSRDRCVVVKLGGSAMEDPDATDTCLRSLDALCTLGAHVVLVHGGGKPIDRAMAEAGLSPKKVAGRRYTDDATLAVVVPVLGEISTNLHRRAGELGLRTQCYFADAADNGFRDFFWPLDGEPLTLATPDGRPVDLGRVGTVTRVDAAAIAGDFTKHDVWDPFIPIIPSLARDSAGGWLNVNADTAAAAVAGALKADKAIFLTDTPGVLRNRSEPTSLIPRLTDAECRRLISSGVIDGGMVPKVEACFEALAAGAKSALILDGRVPYSLLDVFLHDTFTGTEITK
jgi:acetylglutamate kinase